MAVVVADPINLALDRIAAIISGADPIEFAHERARILRALWLGVYSDARDRGEHFLAEIAATAFFLSHDQYEALTDPP